jgi:hypothetical protein
LLESVNKSLTHAKGLHDEAVAEVIQVGARFRARACGALSHSTGGRRRLPEEVQDLSGLPTSSGGWLTAASNSIKALAATPPYDKMVELTEVLSGPDAPPQIAAYESMIASGADAIITFPVNVTALNRTIRKGCDKGVIFFHVRIFVTEPCALPGARDRPTDSARTAASSWPIFERQRQDPRESRVSRRSRRQASLRRF